MAQEGAYAANHSNVVSPKVTSSGYSEMSSNHSGEDVALFLLRKTSRDFKVVERLLGRRAIEP